MNAHPRLHGALTPFAGVFLLILLATTVAFPKVAAPPGARPYVACHVDPSVAETDERVMIYVDSVTWQYDNLTGNFSLLPSWSKVNVTVYDVDHDVVIAHPSDRFFNGTAEFILWVEPVWSSTQVNITVQDQDGLVGYCSLKTTYSMDHLVWLFEHKWIGIFLEYKQSVDAKAQADLDARTYLMLATFTALSVALFLGFLKYDHRKMRGVGLPSLWDRFANKVWPFSLLNDSEYIRLGEDSLDSWDRESVEKQKHHKVERAVRSLEKVKARVEADIERVKAGGEI